MAMTIVVLSTFWNVQDRVALYVDKNPTKSFLFNTQNQVPVLGCFNAWFN